MEKCEKHKSLNGNKNFKSLAQKLCKLELNDVFRMLNFNS